MKRKAILSFLLVMLFLVSVFPVSVFSRAAHSHVASGFSGSYSKKEILRDVLSPGVQASGQVDILTHSGWLDSIGYYHVSGEVQNVGSGAVNYVEIVATFYNSSNVVVATDFTFTDVDVILPGRKSPFDVLLYDSTQSARVDHYSLAATYSTTNAIPKVLEILSYSSYTDTYGYMHVVGEIRNNGAANATFVEVIATFYDSTGKVVVTDFTFANPYDLQPNQVAPFEVLLSHDQLVPLVSTYTLTAQSNEYAMAVHDVAVTSVTCFKTVVGQGFGLNASVTLANLGDYTEATNVSICYIDAAQRILSSPASNLESIPNGISTVVVLTWNTTGIPYGNYTLGAYASPVPSETCTTNNTFWGGWVIVTIPDDINGDWKVSLPDLVLLAAAYGSHCVSYHYQGEQASPNWNPTADVNNDGIVNLQDLVILAQHYGQHYP